MRLRGWSVDWFDAVLVVALVVSCGLAFTAPVVAAEIVRGGGNGGVVLVALLLLSLLAGAGVAVELVTRKRSYRKD